MKHDFNTIHLFRSIRFIPENVLNAQEKLILYTLLSCANQDNDSWNGHEKLSELTGIGRSSIKKYMKSLEQKKFISIQRPVHYQRKETNHYALNVDNIMQYFIENKGSPDDPGHAYRGRHATGPGSPDDHDRGRQTTTKKQIEVTKEERAREAASREALRGAQKLTPEELYEKEKDLPPTQRSPEYKDMTIPMPAHVKEKLDKLFNRVNVH